MNYRRILHLGLALVAGFPCFANIIINEIHYDPPVKTELAEFIELHNTGTTTVDLSGWQLANGVDFTFPTGTTIGAGAYLVIAENPAAFRTKFGGNALGPWTGLLANDGESIILRNATRAVIDEVDFQLGFPWPTVGDLPGYSIELVNPAFDNDLGGSWRASVRGNPAAQTQVLVPEASAWKYQKGTAEPSAPSTAWRDLNYNDAAWPSGAAPIGYDGSLPMGTALNDMRGAYTSFYMRRKFQVVDPSAIGSLNLGILYDDGIQVWINGRRVVNSGMPDRDVAFDELASGPTRESAAYDEYIVNSPASFLRAGENVIAIQTHNILFTESSDAFADVKVTAQLGSPNAGPTPGSRNAVYDTNLPPHIRQVDHSPNQPAQGQPVKITAKITDPDGVTNVRLLYQAIDPGNYLELNDASYETSWTPRAMNDSGTDGDQLAGDGVYTVTMPGSLHEHRYLIRYRIESTDAGNRTIRAPYLDDPSPNFAYFVYNGVPGWQASIRPGSAPVENFSAAEMGRLPTYHLIAKRSSVEDATWNSRYTGDLYRWWGTLIYNGKVYDHIRYRARGGVWRYAMGKNMWKFDFNRGHDFEPSDNFGEAYKAKWRKLNLGANIQQGDYLHRGEQGMFESVGLRLFNMAGVESPKTHWITYRVIDSAEESPANNQFGGDYWGLYLAVEQEDGRFLDEHDLPDGNLYKMEGGTGELNNQGRTAVSDKSDLNTFLNTYRNTAPTIAWWRQNADLQKIYSYHAIVEGIHHYDICFGKNYFYFRNPISGQWAIHAWDLDLTWADNMFGASCDDIRDHIITRAPFDIEYRNRVREVRDLLFNSDQAWKVIDEYATIVRGTNGGPNILTADRAMWDYNPIMNNGAIVNTSKAGQGRFYTFPHESQSNPSRRGSFDATVLIMKDYVAKRSAHLANLSADTAIPSTPTISYAGPTNYPANRIELRSSAFSGGAGFGAIQWRVGEIRVAAPGVPGRYEIETAWVSPEISTFNDRYTIPPGTLKVGHTYRARVKMKDSTGRWSHWSAPIEFTAAEPDNSAALQQNLQVTEIMYNPILSTDYEYVELYNRSSNITLQLSGVAFTEGIDFIFPAGAVLGPNEYALVVRGSFATLRQYYNLSPPSKLFGPYAGSLNNDGERLTARTASAGDQIFSFAYDDGPGWPIAGDGTGHSIESTNGSPEYGGNWHPSSVIGGSPHSGFRIYSAVALINEFAAHTDYTNPSRPEYDSNDWIELYNPGTFLDQAVDLGNYYLSDDAGNLGKWRLPNITLQPRVRITFDEITHFHSPITSGFGLDKAGEELYLTEFGTNGPVRVIDSVRFEGQENGFTFGRYPDGGSFYYTIMPTRDTPNTLAATSLAVSEVMYHPREDTNGVENAWQEFVEIHNTSGLPVSLWNTNGAWRVRGGISFDLPSSTVIPANGGLVLVNFNPTNSIEAARFKTFYGAETASATLAGPFAGRFANSSDRISLEKPDAPDLPGEPVVWITVDQVIYTDASGADGNSESLHRIASNRSGNDPANFTSKAPTPGVFLGPADDDTDNDGMPDDWETTYGLNPAEPTDATLDRDNDGLTNHAEFLAGTDPTSSVSGLAMTVTRSDTGASLTINAVAGKTYSVLYKNDLTAGTWQKLRDLTGAGPVTITDIVGQDGSRYYRVVTPAQL